jgi:methyl coenzyme M reductase gamma subunit
MTRQLRGGEGFNYGAGNIRSKHAAEIKSIREIQNRRDEIIPKAEMDKIKDESQDKLVEVLDELRPYYRFDGKSYGYLNDASGAIGEGWKGINEAFKLDADGKKIINDYISYVKNLPTQYFETKMQSA